MPIGESVLSISDREAQLSIKKVPPFSFQSHHVKDRVRPEACLLLYHLKNAAFIRWLGI